MQRTTQRVKLLQRYHYSSDTKPKVPTFFHNELNVPEKLNIENVTPIQTDKNNATVTAIEEAVGKSTGNMAKMVAPKPIFSNGDVAGATSKNTHSYFSSYKEFCKGIAYLGVGLGVTFFLFDQHERLDESERKMNLMRKKQKELAVQMQTYKTKLSKIAIENAKKNVILQGKMQMHIALLRKQLIELGAEPIDIENAIQQFEKDVKVDVAANAVELWVPGESEIKRLIPDPHEYSQRK